ncbi:hypothetical protein [Microlunatus sp. Gsoil 973]|uniref:hypothetical protein n=1 Tax=Microlunatus sp. Gsoil 973 TaxID=2672569 RepID=UPI0012B47C2B|nr:hypothetical protein [Microlunatus sp. Gsoil 973]QGN32545.1 hypothetical protein GJV80_06745 [Microlunatus sp. Gsoil 973]
MDARWSKWAATQTWRGSLALGTIWGVLAVANWLVIIFDWSNADWFRFLGAALLTVASAGYLNSARVLSRIQASASR